MPITILMWRRQEGFNQALTQPTANKAGSVPRPNTANESAPVLTEASPATIISIPITNGQGKNPFATPKKSA